MRQTNIEKALAKDKSQNDENYYALATNSGFSGSFSKVLADKSDKPDQPCCLIRTSKDKNVPKATSQEQQCNINVNINGKGTTYKNMLIVTLILIVLSFGGVLAYRTSVNSGSSPRRTIIYKKIGNRKSSFICNKNLIFNCIAKMML